MIILDTNVVSEVMRLVPDPRVVAWIDQHEEGSIWITSITVFEIRTGIELLPIGRRRHTLSSDFERFLDTDIQERVVAFDTAAAEVAATLAADRRRAGRGAEIHDTIIAGIAMVAEATLATRNVRHFEDLSVTVVDPWSA